jgi:hypothetical protein
MFLYFILSVEGQTVLLYYYVEAFGNEKRTKN